MQIAALAFDRLDPLVKAKVAELLKRNPDYGTWVQGVPDADKARHAFIRAAVWADDIKVKPDYIRDGNRPSGPHASDNIGYVDKRMHAYWHYIDFPFSDDNTPVQAPDNPNALTQIRVFTDTLRGDADENIKSYDLVWLLHLVGDAHQPLHATQRFSRQLIAGDSGGNEEKVCVSLVCELKLHGFWDSLLGDRGTPEEAIAKAGQLPTADANRAAVVDPKVWFEDSFALAKRFVYTSAIGDGHGPFTLDADYQARALEIARSQAALAGARLANLLNDALR